MNKTHKLYAMAHSLYSARARSYLIKQGIAFTEFSTGHESFKSEVLPEAKLPTIPTLVTPQGEVIRDGAAIIEHFEAANAYPNHPVGACQRIISLLFDVIGSDGLLRPAMHYRWNFPEENGAFVRYHFLHSQRDLPSRQEKTNHMMGRMRFAAQMFGVTPETQPLVESLYAEYLAALNTHFEQYPYLLGWRPCIGDFGLLGPMYAHLGRDPYPARLMQQAAVCAYRWVERMNRADQDAAEYFSAGSGYLDDDQVPDSLLAVLRVLAKDFLPETEAAASVLNQWLANDPPQAGSCAVTRLGTDSVVASFSVEGQPINAVAQAYRFYLLQRVTDAIEMLDESDRARVMHLLESCGLARIADIKLIRRLGRQDNLEIWL